MSDIDWKTLRIESLKDFNLAVMPPTIRLPALPIAVTQFTQRANDPNATTKELAKIIETDAGLTVELLRYVNSSVVGLRHRAGSVHQAISLLGIRPTKLFLITTGMQSAIQARKSKLIHQGGFWNTCLQKALFSREVARLLHADLDLAIAGALLQDYLLPVITNEMTDTYCQFLDRRNEQSNNLCDFEQSRFGWNHALAGASLAARWQLPDELICCILHHHWGLRILAHPEFKRSSVAAVALSSLLPDQMKQEVDGFPMLVKLQTIWKSFDLPAICESVDQLQAESGLGVNNDFPLTPRCHQAMAALA
ncbi:MAG: HDOD domain-containing protein [Planctomycetota bacterium]|nr:HDOD domain-containing protein [Planctomycetota bacterium]MDA1214241.1 HDOD domain-containing protein [Planctomycetota bacterium]